MTRRQPKLTPYQRRVQKVYTTVDGHVERARVRLRRALDEHPEEWWRLRSLMADLGLWQRALKRAQREAGLL